ncbi:O-antigen ligase [Geomicrobium sp. JCM 19055]|uniref:O-antigen ligase family protein n=1 Tax=Geomicrobium sp. JCM 19055 TaxID=1460649 RepID=UPI002235D4F7|nr:O-antigen ligase family protein [Geomicrobium sp. JCM 19055]
MTQLHDRKGKVGLFLCILASILTFSRGGLLVLFGLFILYFIFRRGLNRLKTIMVTALGGVIIYTVAFYVLHINIYDLFVARMGDLTYDGGSNRIDLWARAIGFMTDNPWIGLGPYNYAQYNEYYYGVDLSAHNTYLDILTDAGVLSLLFLSVVSLRRRVSTRSVKVVSFKTVYDVCTNWICCTVIATVSHY